MKFKIKIILNFYSSSNSLEYQLGVIHFLITMFLLAKINETGRPCSAFESNIPLKPGQDIHDQSIKNN